VGHVFVYEFLGGGYSFLKLGREDADWNSGKSKRFKCCVRRLGGI